MRLFVDVDDTLVLYQDDGQIKHPYGVLGGTPWEANEPLIARIRDFRDNNPDALIVVWSGGGLQYAATIADRLLSGIGIVPLTKDKSTFHLVGPGDIVVDDSVSSVLVGVPVFGPHDSWPTPPDAQQGG